MPLSLDQPTIEHFLICMCTVAVHRLYRGASTSRCDQRFLVERDNLFSLLAAPMVQDLPNAFEIQVASE